MTNSCPKKGILAKAKGRRGEYELRDFMTRISGVKYGRTPLSGSFHLDFPFDCFKRENKESIFDGVGNENKNTKRLAVGDWIKQTEIACQDFFQTRDNHKFFIRFKFNGKPYYILSEPYFTYLLTFQKWKNH